ncbi:tetratricopeptide repeat protein [Streptomyces sp. NPDC018833]|uniref:tetratricopeptide repeat protein n=1 Tax=Streptomyces sp. NPDC018833 TaxID=3365053 RepID=UPI0037A71BF5
MKSETVKNAAVSTLVGATLVTCVILLAPGWEDEASPRPAARAMAAAGAGAPAAPADLKALIEDREAWLRDHSRDAESWAVLGAAYVERGTRTARPADFPKAERALRRSLALGAARDGDVRALVGMAALANARHDHVAASIWGERARRQQPKAWTLYPVLADAYNGLGNHKLAAQATDMLQKLHSGPQVRGREAQLYRDKGHREDAAALAYDATVTASTSPEKAAGLLRQGDLAWERGEAAEAVGHYDAALEEDPEAHRALAGRARALVALGPVDAAQRDYEEALEKAPQPEYALEAGELAESLGQDEDAATQYARVRTLVEEARAHGVDNDLVLARYEADHGDPATAVRLLQGEWRRGHRSVYVADAMGWALYRVGRAEDALPFAKLATGQGLRSALFAYHRGQIERELGEYGPARRHIEEALQTNPQFSPLLAPLAREALDTLGEPPPGGPVDMDGDGPDATEEASAADEAEPSSDGVEGEADGVEGEADGVEGESAETEAEDAEAEASASPAASASAPAAPGAVSVEPTAQAAGRS